MKKNHFLIIACAIILTLSSSIKLNTKTTKVDRFKNFADKNHLNNLSVFDLNYDFTNTTIYSENFSGQNGKGSVGPTPTTDLTDVNWTVDISGASLANLDWFQVQNEVFEGQDLDGDAIWFSPTIDISSHTNISFSLLAEENGDHEATDKFITEYRINNGTWIEAETNGNLNDDFTSLTVSQTELSGNTLEIRVIMNNNVGTEQLRLDNILVTGTLLSSNTSVSFKTATLTISEGINSIDVCVGITNPDLNNSTTVDVILDGTSTALNPADYSPSLSSATELIFPAGSSNDQCITINLTDDATIEPNEILVLNLQNASQGNNAALGSIAQYTLTITDNDLPDIVISEIMYNTPTPGSDDEWIELYNDENSSVDINGYTLEYGSNSYTFSSATIIPSKDYITIALGSSNNQNTFEFNTNYPFEPDFNTLGLTTFGDLITSNNTNKLNNSTASIILKNDSDIVIDTVTYDDGDTDGNHDGNGKSIEVVDVNNDNSVTSSNWRSSSNNGGSPGASITTTWTGDALTEVWNTSGNWDNGIPTSNMNAYIQATSTRPTISSSAVANNILIVSEASLVTKDATSVVGEITFQRSLNFVSGNLKGWHLMSIPVSNQGYNNSFVKANDIAMSDTNRGIATYNTTGNSWSYLQNNESGTFSSGQGYSIKRASTAGAISFTGTINTNNTGVNVVLSNNGNRYNALGNPYTSYINSAIFLNNETSISNSKTLWVWDQELGINGAYSVKDVDDAMIIAPGQGFFVQADDNAGTFNFSESNQIHTSPDTFKKSTSSTIVKLWLKDGTIKNYNRIKYLRNVTTGFDLGYEGEMFNGSSNSFAIYSQLVSDDNGKKYQSQSVPNTDYENIVIPIGINAEADRQISISSENQNLPEGIKVYLEDRIANIFTRLDEANSEYTITLTEKLDGIGRFYLHTKSSVLNTSKVTSLNYVNIYQLDTSTLQIVGLYKGLASIKLFNSLGKEILNSSFITNGTKNITLPNLATGIYIVQLETESGQLNKKITLR